MADKAVVEEKESVYTKEELVKVAELKFGESETNVRAALTVAKLETATIKQTEEAIKKLLGRR